MADFFLRLELDSFGLKAMIIEQGYKKSLILNSINIRYKELAGIDSKDTDTDPFNAAMDKVAGKLDLSACSTAVILVSPHNVCFRNIDIPFGSEKKIKQILPFELETLLPLPHETYISDFNILDTSTENKLILSASIAESLIEKYFSTLDRYGIRPRVITPGGYAAAIGFLSGRKDITNFCFLHLSEPEITLVLVNNRKPCLVRIFLSSHGNLPDELALGVKQAVIGFNQKTGQDLFFDIFVCADQEYPGSENIYNALEKTLEYQSGLRSLQHGIQNTLIQEKISSSTMLLNITPDKNIKYLFNFCRGKYGTSSFFKTYFSSIAASVILFLFTLILIMVTAGMDNSNLEKKITALDNRAFSIFTTTFPGKRKIRDPYLQMKANVLSTIKKSGTRGNKNRLTSDDNIHVMDIISEISGKIADSIDIDISRFLFNNGRLVLSGSTDNFNNVDRIKSRLETSDLFKRVNISSAAADKKGDRVNFKFIIEI